MISDSHSRDLAATKRVFTRPANLHLAWSTSKGVASPFNHNSYSSSSSTVASSSSQLSLSSLSQYNPTQPPVPQISAPLPSHPYSSFVSRSDDAWAAISTERASTMIAERHSSTASKRSWTEASLTPSGLILKSGTLTWRDASDNSSRKGALSGFEKALRRRQAGKAQPLDRDRTVHVTLEQARCDSSSNSSISSRCSSKSISSSPGRPRSRHSFASEPFMASPGACDPSAFEIDGFSSLVSPPVPMSLVDESRWVPPSSWDVFATSSDSHDSQSKSSCSSVSDPLQTPTPSQPGSPKEHDTFLTIYSHTVSRGRSASASRSAPVKKLRITQMSTVEMQSCPSEGGAVEGGEPFRYKQLRITGESVANDHSSDLQLREHPTTHYNDNTQLATCILSSPDVAELYEWLYAIEDAVERCRNRSRERFETRRSSGSMLDTIRLLEQLRVQRGNDRSLEKDQLATPVAASRSLPSPGLLTPSAAFASASFGGSGSDFSPSTFIDYYAANPDSAKTVANSDVTTASEALYDFEDAYSSIMQRFSDYELASPLEGLPSAPLNGHVRHVRSECLDVPVSPCSIDFDRHDYWNEQDEAPSSPLDPWLTQRGARSESSLSNHDMEAFADETVKQIFAEGFRRRSSTLSCLPADS